MPRDNGDNKHGTRCAGEVAAVAFNSFCGIGVAYNASIGGTSLLSSLINLACQLLSELLRNNEGRMSIHF